MIKYQHMQAKIAIIIPTYNARNTIIQLVSKVLKTVKNSIVIVVDDNSPDKTASLIKSHFSKNKRVLLIIRSGKGGRGYAVIQGFKEAIKLPTIQYFIEMDADFAHNPKDILRLMQKVKNYDIAVASRYLFHSHIIKWSIKRRLISKFANLWIKMMLGISLSDNTNGFRCYTRHVLEAIDFDLILARGFIVLTEISYQIYKKGFRFGEVPIDFIPADLNKSNLNMREVKEAIYTVFRLKMKDFRIK